MISLTNETALSSIVNDRSIFKMSTGSIRRCSSEVYPVPKSSIAIAYSLFTQQAEAPGGLGNVAEQGTFGDLDHDEGRVDPGITDRPHDVGDEALDREMAPRHIDVHRYVRKHLVIGPPGNLFDGVGNDPVVELEYQVTSFGDRYERIGERQAAVRPLPTDQRFERDQTAVGIDDRLIEEDQFVVLQRSVEIPFDCCAMKELGVQRLVAELNPRPAQLLRLVHGEIGVVQQLVGGESRGFVGEGNTDGCADSHRGGPDPDRSVDLLRHTLSEEKRPRRSIHRLGHDHELVTAESTDEIAGPDRRAQALADDAEHLVAGRVTVPVVDILEAIQIEEHDRQHRARTTGPFESPAELYQRRLPIGDARQGVMSRLVGQQALVLLARR